MFLRIKVGLLVFLLQTNPMFLSPRQLSSSCYCKRYLFTIWFSVLARGLSGVCPRPTCMLPAPSCTSISGCSILLHLLEQPIHSFTRKPAPVSLRRWQVGLHPFLSPISVALWSPDVVFVLPSTTFTLRLDLSLSLPLSPYFLGSFPNRFLPLDFKHHPRSLLWSETVVPD